MNEEACIRALTMLSFEERHWVKICITFLKNNSDFNYDEIYYFYKYFITHSPGLISEIFETMINFNNIIPDFKFNYGFMDLCTELKCQGINTEKVIVELKNILINKDTHE